MIDVDVAIDTLATIFEAAPEGGRVPNGTRAERRRA
jgi:hypothetical protein